MSYRKKAKNKVKKTLGIIGMVIGGIALLFVLSFAVMWLWNWLMPTLFGLTTITYWQGLGLAALGRLILGGFGGGHGGHNDCDDQDRPIRSEIRKEINKEFDREFDKEFDKSYDEWWEAKGKDSFKDYLNDDEKDE